MATAIIVASGFNCSSAFTLDRRAFALLTTGSGAPANVRIGFAETLTANSAAFCVLHGDNTGLPLMVFSGGTQLCSQPLPAITPYARVVLTATATWPVSFTLLPLTQ